MSYEELKKFFPEEGNRCKAMCGKCCTNTAPVGRQEALEIADWIVENVKVEQLKEQFAHFDDHPGQCPFLKPDKGCFVYPARPLVCRMFGHLPDAPGAPKKWSQQCPEGVAFTQVSVDSLVEHALPFMIEQRKQQMRTFEFRFVGMADETGKEFTIDIKPGSPLDKLRNAKACYRCATPFEKGGNAYLEGAELLCETCENKPA